LHQLIIKINFNKEKRSLTYRKIKKSREKNIFIFPVERTGVSTFLERPRLKIHNEIASLKFIEISPKIIKNQSYSPFFYTN